MFTGLIDNQGVIAGRESSGRAGRIFIKPDKKYDAPVYGESIAVNGCCLTLESVNSQGILACHTLEETLEVTNLGTLPVGARVNLERAMKLGDRLGGHLVAGHVDSVAEVIGLDRQGDDQVLKIRTPESLRPYLLPKGSVAVDGVSLTLVEVKETFFSVHLIPVTLKDTALGSRKGGDPVNLEGDMIGKYVMRQLEFLNNSTRKSEITMDTLRDAGFL